MNTSWLSAEWFRPDTLLNFHWAQPVYLYGLAFIPLLFLIRWFRPLKRVVSLPFILPDASTDRFRWVTVFRHLIPLCFSLGLALAILALARPQRTLASEDQIPEGLNLILALDISESMLATDLQPTRLAAAKNVASRFIKNRTHDKIGLVVFAGEAFSLCPLTTDYRVLQSYIDLIQPSLIPAAGTAIGSALAVGINRLRDIPGSNKAIILLSDGDNTAGSLPPEIASELAKSFNIRIYSIALGTQNAAEINRDILKEVAGTGQGQFFDASSATNLQAVFHQIESLEKARLLDHFRQEFSDYYTIYLRWALVFFILALVFRVSPLGNILED